jgi:glutamine amidotransferase PdxT
MMKSNVPIPACSDFRYFEIEVSENHADSNIIIGLIEAKDVFTNNIRSLEQFTGEDTLIIHGGEGTRSFGAYQKAKKINKALTMKELGDCVGVCLHY